MEGAGQGGGGWRDGGGTIIAIEAMTPTCCFSSSAHRKKTGVSCPRFSADVFFLVSY